MLNQAELAQNLTQRVTRGKDGAYLFNQGEKVWLSTNAKRFDVVEYSISITDRTGRKLFLRGNEMKRSPGLFTLILDDKGPEDDCVRFVFFEGESIVMSSIEVASAYVWIVVATSNPLKAHVVAFVITSDDDEKKSALLSDSDTGIVHFCMLAGDRGAENV